MPTLRTLLLLATLFTGCSASGVAERQQSLSNTQDRILENRSIRMQQRDERMWNARDVLMQ